jgi:hypothetical protein
VLDGRGVAAGAGLPGHFLWHFPPVGRDRRRSPLSGRCAIFRSCMENRNGARVSYPPNLTKKIKEYGLDAARR